MHQGMCSLVFNTNWQLCVRGSDMLMVHCCTIWYLSNIPDM